MPSGETAGEFIHLSEQGIKISVEKGNFDQLNAL